MLRMYWIYVHKARYIIGRKVADGPFDRVDGRNVDYAQASENEAQCMTSIK